MPTLFYKQHISSRSTSITNQLLWNRQGVLLIQRLQRCHIQAEPLLFWIGEHVFLQQNITIRSQKRFVMRLNFIFVILLSGLHHGDSYVIVNSMSWAVTAEVEEELDTSSNEETIPALLEDTGSFWKQSYPASVINNDVERSAAPSTVDAKQISTPSRMFSYKREAVSAADSPPPHPHDEIARTARYLAHYSSWGFLATISTHEKVQNMVKGEAERPQPKREEPVHPQLKRGEAECRQPTSPPAEGEFLLVPPLSPWEDWVSIPPPPAEGEFLLVPPPPPWEDCVSLPPPPAEGEYLLVPPPPPWEDRVSLPPPPAEGEFLLVPPPPPWEDCVSLPPPPAEGEFLLVPPPLPWEDCVSLPPPPAEGEFLLVPPPPPWEDCVSLPPPPAEGEFLLVPPPPPWEDCYLVPSQASYPAMISKEKSLHTVVR
ncbi:UNVERIFIED_CONTAM: hypothetical protein FKN15_002644 [Acipenser sinensis]